jgi:cupin 2 domain-containing protein
MTTRDGNLFDPLPGDVSAESIEELLAGTSLRLERIVSRGQATPPGEWYDQDRNEWVVLLSGSATLRFEDEPQARTLQPGDHVWIAAHRRHRVESTDGELPSVWLALHYDQGPAVPHTVRDVAP